MSNLENRIAIVTGGGSGLGRTHSIELAKYGATVVVSDLNLENAKFVCDEIKKSGGKAIPFCASVTDEAQIDNMVKHIIKEFGRIDILINNAGILRDKSFSKMTLEDFDLVMNVHVRGAYIPTKAVWDIMKNQNYGRVVFTTSSSGLYGNFGQSNYSAAKMALVGLMNTLKIEGMKNNIRVNSLAPVATTAMTKDLMPPQIIDLLKPEFVSPAIVYLSGENAPNGMILTAGAGSFAAAKIIETKGISFKDNQINSENIEKNIDLINDINEAEEYSQGAGQTQKFITGKI